MKTSLAVLREGGRVVRFHQVPWNGDRQDNASHSWGVATLLEFLWPGQNTAQILLAALFHDLHEGVTGSSDMSSFFKKQMTSNWRSELADYERTWEEAHGLSEYTDVLTYHDTVRLKLADMLELYVTALEQRMMGNEFMNLVIFRMDHYLKEYLIVGKEDDFYTPVAEMVQSLRDQFCRIAGFEPEDFCNDDYLG